MRRLPVAVRRGVGKAPLQEALKRLQSRSDAKP
jgi:hypothetical protein